MLNRIYKSNSKLFHDLDAHLNVLYQLLEDKNIDDAKNYIKKLARLFYNYPKRLGRVQTS